MARMDISKTSAPFFPTADSSLDSKASTNEVVFWGSSQINIRTWQGIMDLSE